MRTSLLKLQEIEQHLLQSQPPQDRLLFEARMLIDDELAESVGLQSQAYAIINAHGRRQLKQEMEAVHQQLFTQAKHQRFKNRIMALFK